MKKNSWMKVAGIVILFMLLIVILAGIFGESEGPDQNKTEKEAVLHIRYEDIRRNMQNMTALRFEEYRDSIIGKRVLWAGYVTQVKEKLLGGYEVLVDMDDPNTFSVQDVYFDISKQTAMKLLKNSSILFEGDIKNIVSIMGSCQVTLKNAEISSIE